MKATFTTLTPNLVICDYVDRIGRIRHLNKVFKFKYYGVMKIMKSRKVQIGLLTIKSKKEFEFLINHPQFSKIFFYEL